LNQANFRELAGFGLLYYSVTQSTTYQTSQNYLTNVGAFSGSPGAYGTFDQNGNVSELNDLDGTPGEERGYRGGSWADTQFDLPSSSRFITSTTNQSSRVGFRLASPVPVPEPSTWVMAGFGLACAGWGAFRRRKRA